VLTIGKLGASKGQLQYYERQVAAGVEDYYSGRGEASGVWQGAGARALGLEAGRAVDAGQFMALMRGESPVDGALLRRMGSCSTVAAIDLTFSAPKSVSVLFAVGEGQVPAALVAAHERAVGAALGYLEREACFTRRGHAGSEQVRGEGFIAAGYRHRFSRAGDPQLHTHVVVGNLTRADGRYTALDAHALYQHKSAAGAVYRAVLRAEMRERLPWVTWRPAGRGLFEIDGVPEPVLRHFSQRRAEIESRAAEIAGSADHLSRDRMQGIALATRRPKDDPAGGDWREVARARAAEHGCGHAELAALSARTNRADLVPDLERLWSRLSGPAGLTEMHNTFARRHALAEIAGAFPDGARLPELEATTDRYLTDSSVHRLPVAADDEARFTAESLLACERTIVDSAQRRHDAAAGRVSAAVAARVTSGWQPALNPAQAAAVHALTSDGHGIDVVCALAGTGKTTMVASLAACYQDAGYQVIGTAPTARAARELRDVAAIPAGTMHALISELDRAGGFAQRTVLVIDEAGMASTRIAAAIFAHAEQADTKIIAVGDPGQLASVHAGGWLAGLAGRHPGPQLREVIRQRDPAERAALEALHDGHPDAYLEHQRDSIAVHHHETDALDALVNQWAAARRRHGPQGTVMIARDNETRAQLNHTARERLKRDGVLCENGVRVGHTEYTPGDRIIARRNHPGADIDNGTLGTVLAVDARTHRMRITTTTGQQRELDLSYVARHVEHGYALTAHSTQGATVTWAGVIGRPGDFTREWAYTALSRAREHTELHLIAEPPTESRDRTQYAPATPISTAANALDALERRMRQSESEPLALDHHDPQAALNAPRPLPDLPAVSPPNSRPSRRVTSVRGPTVHQ
jgi:conjugative relaxase-like TrwC/TraI family protein